jgi:hypothetical protein
MSDSHAAAQQEQEKETTIIVNARPKVWTAKDISFEQVISLAYDGNPPGGPDWVFTVTYRKGEDKKKEGTMVEGDSVHVKDGMVFNVTATNRS